MPSKHRRSKHQHSKRHRCFFLVIVHHGAAPKRCDNINQVLDSTTQLAAYPTYGEAVSRWAVSARNGDTLTYCIGGDNCTIVYVDSNNEDDDTAHCISKLAEVQHMEIEIQHVGDQEDEDDAE